MPLTGEQGVGASEVDFLLLERLAASNAIRVQRGGGIVGTIALPGARKAVQALRTCNESLLREWGVDPILWTSLRRLPTAVGGAPSLFTNDDYPETALRQNATGKVVVRIDVSASGRATDCASVRSSGNAWLDAKSYSVIMRRARFEPAIGADGSPVAAPAITSVTWSLPGRR